MQGEWTGELAGPDVWVTCRELIPPSSVFAFLAEQREVLFPAGMFADMYPSPNGRPSMPPQILAAAVTLQALNGLSDIETVQELRCDLRWKAACGLGLYDTAFDSSLLAYFRRRLSRSADPQRIFTAVRAVVAETGVLKAKVRRALDSTVLDDTVATQDTVTQIIAAIRRVAREVPGAPEVVTAVCTGHDYTDPGKPKIAWNDQGARAELIDAPVTDAIRLLAALPEREHGPKAADALGLLALVTGQDVEPADGSDGRDGRWRITRGTAPDRVVSTVDPESRHVHKTRSHKQDGYKAHLAIEPETGIHTAVAIAREDLEKLTRLSGSRYYPTREKIAAKIGTIAKERRVTDCPHTEIIDGLDGKPSLVWHFDQDVIAVQAKADGWYALITNQDPAKADAAAIFLAHKGQPQVERRYHELKGPLAVAPVFLHGNKRIAALLHVLMLALLVYSLIERQVRRALEHEGSPDGKMTGLYPDNRRERPTARMIFYHLGELDLATAPGSDPPQVLHITRGVQLHLLDLLEINLS